MDPSLDPIFKTCPNCGHENRAGARHCSSCGYAFFTVQANGTVRKRCANCGHLNSIGAKVCSACGSAFQGVVMVTRGSQQKWCPRCGRERRPGAKVCVQCGYRFKETPVEPPVKLSPELAKPAALPESPSKPSPTLPPLDLSGEPAPYLPDEELDRLRGMSNQHVDVFVRLSDIFHRLKD